MINHCENLMGLSQEQPAARTAFVIGSQGSCIKRFPCKYYRGAWLPGELRHFV